MILTTSRFRTGHNFITSGFVPCIRGLPSVDLLLGAGGAPLSQPVSRLGTRRSSSSAEIVSSPPSVRRQMAVSKPRLVVAAAAVLLIHTASSAEVSAVATDVAASQVALRLVRPDVDAPSPREPCGAYSGPFAAAAITFPRVPRPPSIPRLINDTAPKPPRVPSFRAARARPCLTSPKTAIRVGPASVHTPADAWIDPLTVPALALGPFAAPSNTPIGSVRPPRHASPLATTLGAGDAAEPVQALAPPRVPSRVAPASRPTAAKRLSAS